MMRLLSSLLVLLLGMSDAPARGARARKALRPRLRLRPDPEGATDRALEATVRSRARAQQLRRSWSGSVELVHETHTTRIPGTWTLDAVPLQRGAFENALVEAPPIPPLATETVAWAARMRRVLSLQEPRVRLRVGHADATGWQTLEVTVPTRPPTVVQVDRDAIGQLLDSAVTVRLRIKT